MNNVTPDTEQFQHFQADLKETFWGDIHQSSKLALKDFLEAESKRERLQYLGLGYYEHSEQTGRDYRNGYYERDFVTRFGTIRLRISRTREKNFLPPGLDKFQRRADEVMFLIKEMFLQGVSTRKIGELVAIFTEESVSAQTVSNLTKCLGKMVQQFHEMPLDDDWAYLFLDGISLKVRQPGGKKRVQLLVAYGQRTDGRRQLLAFMRSSGESQAAWEGLLNDLYNRGLKGKNLRLIVTDGCPGLAAALQVVYPRVPHQRCWVHKMRNIINGVRKRDREEVKTGAQAIYTAKGRGEAALAFKKFKLRWQREYPTLVKRLERDLPELLAFFSLPEPLWRSLRTTNVIERCFVEVRRRTRPMVCFVNIDSVDRIIYAIFNAYNQKWQNRTLKIFTQAA